MYRDNYISTEVMHYFLGFSATDLNAQPLAIDPAPSRLLQPIITPPDVDVISPPNSDPIQITKNPVLPPVTLLPTNNDPIPSNPISTVSTPKRSVLTPTLSMSSGVPTTPIDNDTLEVFRVYNSNDGTHHYTMNENKRDSLVAIGWNYEGIAWYAKTEGTVSVFRMYNPGNGEHVWTTNYDEIENAVAHGWRYEGIAWYIE
jgi:hypothetical protein